MPFEKHTGPNSDSLWRSHDFSSSMTLMMCPRAALPFFFLNKSHFKLQTWMQSMKFLICIFHIEKVWGNLNLDCCWLRPTHLWENSEQRKPHHPQAGAFHPAYWASQRKSTWQQFLHIFQLSQFYPSLLVPGLINHFLSFPHEPSNILILLSQTQQT